MTSCVYSGFIVAEPLFQSISVMRKPVSKTTSSYRRDPFTEHGIRLAAVSDGLESAAFQIHEVGRLQLTAAWSYAGVCSPFWRLYHNAQPGAAVRVGTRRIDLDPEIVLLLPPLVNFDCLPAPGIDHLWVHFSTPLKIPQLREATTQVLSPATSALVAQMRVLLEAGVGPERLRHAAMAWLHTLWSEPSHGDVVRQSPRLQRVWMLIESRLASPPDLNTLATSAGFSPGAFVRWFKEEMGTTPTAFVVRRRVIEACRLLRYSDSSIEEVAEATGFANRHHFTRVFSREVGESPGAFRHRSGPENC